jgi:hypothetical protein
VFEQGSPFHCCLELSKVDVKIFDRLCTGAKKTGVSRRKTPTPRVPSSTFPHYTLSLVPPIVLENMLPYTIVLRIFEGNGMQPEVRPTPHPFFFYNYAPCSPSFLLLCLPLPAQPWLCCS